jgi:hypothetical protein
MAVTFELLEEFTGTRINTMPDPENLEETIEVTQENVIDIQVRFTCEHSGCTHERSVNVVFDSEGNYDHDATLVRCEEVAMGVAAKMACGAIQQTTGE